MQKNLISSILLLVVYYVNYLSSSGQLGANLMNLRDIFPFIYMPSGRTFGVAWSMIYLALGVWLIRSWTKRWQENKTNQKIIPLFRTSCLLNILRITTTANEWYAISVIIIAALMFCLWNILQHIWKQNSWFLIIPFWLYAGWVTMATTLIWLFQFIYSFWWTFVAANRRAPVAILTWLGTATYVYTKRRNPAQLFITCIALAGVITSLMWI
jgi:tryptophan-rich sensory protein